MAGFGDTSTTYQRGAVIPGGLRMETGCITSLTDATFYVSTQFTDVVSVLVNDDGSCAIESIPDISPGYIVATMRNSGNGAVVNYVAFGW